MLFLFLDMLQQSNNFQYQPGMALKVLGTLEEIGALELLAQNPQGLSAKEIAGRLGLIPALLEPVCDFVSVNLPTILRKEGNCYFFDKKTYNQDFWGRLNFILAYEPVFSNLSQLLRGKVKYNKDIRRRGIYLQRSSAIYNAKAWQQIIEVLKKNNPHTIIDLGCGSAEFLIRICLTLPDTFGIGVEIDKKLAVLARGNIKEQKLSERILIIQGDAAKPEELMKHLAFKSDSTRIALVGITIWHEFLINSEKFLIELFRRYRDCFPGSIFIIAEYNGFSFEELINLPQPAREKASFYQLVHPLTNQGLPQSPEKWRMILRKAGFNLRETMAVEPNFTIYICG